MADESSQPLLVDDDAVPSRDIKAGLTMTSFRLLVFLLTLASFALIWHLTSSSDQLKASRGEKEVVRYEPINGLQRTPQLGWNTWNLYKCDINETVILRAAKGLVDSGLKDLGYRVVGIDDCWATQDRDERGRLQARPNRFPRGIRALADDIHAVGLKLGIYSSAGFYTCQHDPASLDHELIDAQTFADWHIDYLKYDNCYNQRRRGNATVSLARYDAMSTALRSTGRDIVYALCQWGQDESWRWAHRTANSFRMSGDIWDRYDEDGERCPCKHASCFNPGYQCSMLNILDQAAEIGYDKTGVWQDLDMLEVGNGGMTTSEYETHFTLWAMLKSPLILGNDLGAMSEDTLRIISNQALLAVNQDPLGLPARRIYQEDVSASGRVQWWRGPLFGGRHVIAVLNTDFVAVHAQLPLARLFPPNEDVPSSLELVDLWSGQTSHATETLGAVVSAHGVRVFEARPS